MKTCLICYETKEDTKFKWTYDKKGGKRRRLICVSCAAKGLKEVDANTYKDKILCHSCYKHKDRKSFTKNKSTKTGFSSYCKNCKNEKQNKWKENNKDKVKKYKKDYYENNKAKLYEKTLQRMSKDNLYKMKRRVRSLIAKSFIKKKTYKTNKSLEILGCSMEHFKNHIESQFLNWMNWDNYGLNKTGEYDITWHLDHIIPANCAETEEELITLNHWSNFQPKCGKRNIEKGDVVRQLTNLENADINSIINSNGKN